MAIHEVGHAIVGLTLGSLDIERITILGRGDAAGYVEHRRGTEMPHTKEGYLNKIRICMGGRATEEMIYGAENASTGASEDIQQATYYARLMVNLYGFSEKIGFMGVERARRGYLGTTFEANTSLEMRDAADLEIQRILKECMEETKKIVEENKEILISIAKELFDDRELSGEEMESIYKRVKG